MPSPADDARERSMTRSHHASRARSEAELWCRIARGRGRALNTLRHALRHARQIERGAITAGLPLAGVLARIEAGAGLVSIATLPSQRWLSAAAGFVPTNGQI